MEQLMRADLAGYIVKFKLLKEKILSVKSYILLTDNISIT